MPTVNPSKSAGRPKVISLINEKGGSGKSTLSIMLAGWLHAKGRKVIVLDTDADQGSVCDWSKIEAEYRPAGRQQPIRVERVREPVIDKLVANLGEYDFVLVDGGKGQTRMLLSAANASDLILIPVKPSPIDVWAADIVAQVAAERTKLSGGRILARFVLTQAYYHVPPARITTGSRAQLETSYPEIPLLNTTIHTRQGYLDAKSFGSTVAEMAGEKNASDSILSAAEEINRLGNEVMELLK